MQNNFWTSVIQLIFLLTPLVSSDSCNSASKYECTWGCCNEEQYNNVDSTSCTQNSQCPGKYDKYSNQTYCCDWGCCNEEQNSNTDSKNCESNSQCPGKYDSNSDHDYCCKTGCCGYTQYEAANKIFAVFIIIIVVLILIAISIIVCICCCFATCVRCWCKSFDLCAKCCCNLSKCREKDSKETSQTNIATVDEDVQYNNHNVEYGRKNYSSYTFD